jgi:hypothetical protein
MEVALVEAAEVGAAANNGNNTVQQQYKESRHCYPFRVVFPSP